jgi:hypothetical protein
LAKSAVDVIGAALEHAKQQLFPFRLGQWARLAVLGLATGEMSTGGGCNSVVSLPSHFPNPHQQQNLVSPADLLRGLDKATLESMFAVLVVGGIVLALVWIYVASVSRFVLFESVLRKYCELGPAWNRWQGQGMRLFWFQLGLMVITWSVAGVTLLPLLLPLIKAAKTGQNVGIGFFLAFLPLLVFLGLLGLFVLLVAVLTKDFVVPVMALDGVGVFEGWRRTLAMMKAEAGHYAGYIGMKIVLAIGAGVLFGVLIGIVMFILLIPGALIGVVVVLMGKSAGLGWNAMTITLAVVAGTILLACLLYVVAFVCVPVAVFFPAYAMYFLAERYPQLYARLHPLPPAVPPGASTLPSPAPIG